MSDKVVDIQNVLQLVPKDFINRKASTVRTTRDTSHIASLQTSISSNMGLLHPLIVKPDGDLVAGSCRFDALTNLYALDMPIKFNTMDIPVGMYPVIIAPNAETVVTYLRSELEENLERAELTWSEKSAADARIAKLEQIILNKEAAPTDTKEESLEDIKLENISTEAIKKTSERLYDNKSGAGFTATIANSIALEQGKDIPELAEKLKKAPNMKAAVKTLKTYEKDQLMRNLAATQGKTFNSKMHHLLQGDCLVEMPKLPSGAYPLCITDPIYGINANKFGDAAGKMTSVEHDYDDSPETFNKVMPVAVKELDRIMAKDAHVYLACDLSNFYKLKEWLEACDSGWKVPRNPVIQYKVAGGRVPHPGYTFRRSYECWLYAYRGDKQENILINDVIPTHNDSKESHGARKPVALIETFLQRSAIPGEACIDFMAGTGVTIPACHKYKVPLTVIELSEVNFGKCLNRQARLER